jgi:hypothetical protein
MLVHLCRCISKGKQPEGSRWCGSVSALVNTAEEGAVGKSEGEVTTMKMATVKVRRRQRRLASSLLMNSDQHCNSQVTAATTAAGRDWIVRQ